MRVYVLVNTEPAKEHTIYSALSKNKHIDYIYPLFGEYDLLFRLTIENEQQLNDIMLNQIRTIDGILTTKTLIGY